MQLMHSYRMLAHTGIRSAVLLALGLLRAAPAAADCSSNLLIVLDRSCSMNKKIDDGTGAMKSKWEIATASIDKLLGDFFFLQVVNRSSSPDVERDYQRQGLLASLALAAPRVSGRSASPSKRSAPSSRRTRTPTRSRWSDSISESTQRTRRSSAHRRLGLRPRRGISSAPVVLRGPFC